MLGGAVLRARSLASGLLRAVVAILRPAHRCAHGCFALHPYIVRYAGSPYKRDAVYACVCPSCARAEYCAGFAVWPRTAREREPGGYLDAAPIVPT
jgi:hypothetical protein